MHVGRDKTNYRYYCLVPRRMYSKHNRKEGRTGSEDHSERENTPVSPGRESGVLIKKHHGHFATGGGIRVRG